jgi:two-component system chemotaxis response regulator CheB
VTGTPVRVAICDDSRAYGEGLRRFLETDRGLEVVMVASCAEELLGELPLVRPELITMDLELPGIGGVEAIRRIMAAMPVPIVVVSTHAAYGGDHLADDALAAGALETISKGELRLDSRLTPQAVALRRRLARLARAQASPSAPGPPSAPAPTPAPAGRVSRPAAASPQHGAQAPEAPLPRHGLATVVGIAASAGGPAALGEVLGALPANFGLPVLVVQHISDGFAAGLAEWLNGLVAVPVRLARDGEPAGSGVAIAPDGAHLLLATDGRLELDRRMVRGTHRPSADVLLGSLAAVAGRGAIAVVLTGMGRDGADGVAAVREAGGVALAERSDQAHLPGMPAAAAQAGATPLARADIGRLLASISPGNGR